MKTLCLLIALFLACITPALAEISGVVVVRHAEKAHDDTSDPGLTAAGRARARALAEVVEQANVSGIIATQFRRTQETVAELARERGLDVTVVPAASGRIEAHAEAIAEKVRETRADGILVIAGHSNTVGPIVEALSGRTIPPIEESEYDRLFVLLPADSGMQVISTRYGAPSPR